MNNIANIPIRREIQDGLEAEMEKNIISVIVGPRQVGKTTLLNALAGYLRGEGRDPRSVVSLDFDDLEFRSRVISRPEELRREIETLLGQPLSRLSKKSYVFLDEVQKAPQAIETAKIIFDRYRDRIKIVLSGSSSLEIRRQAAETLAGRIRYHYLGGLTLHEALAHQGLGRKTASPLRLLLAGGLNAKALDEIQAELWEERGSIEILRRRLLLFGTLPAVFLEPSEEERWFLLRDYAAAYIEKDVRALGGVGDLDLFHRLYRVLLLQHGQLLNVSNLSSDIGMARNTINAYLGVLEQTGVIARVTAWSRRAKTRLVKAPKMYFFDPGLVNHAARLNSFPALQSSGRLGAIEEGLLFNQLSALSRNQSMPAEIHYWRDYQGHEVDFVVQGKNSWGVEVTSESRIREKRYRNLARVMREAGLQGVFVIGDFPRWETVALNAEKMIKLPSWMAF